MNNQVKLDEQKSIEYINTNISSPITSLLESNTGFSNIGKTIDTYNKNDLLKEFTNVYKNFNDLFNNINMDSIKVRNLVRKEQNRFSKISKRLTETFNINEVNSSQINKVINQVDKSIKKKSNNMKGGDNCVMLDTSYEHNEQLFFECVKEENKDMHVFKKKQNTNIRLLCDDFLYFESLDDIYGEYLIIEDFVFDGNKHNADSGEIVSSDYDDIRVGKIIIELFEYEHIKKKFNGGSPVTIHYNSDENELQDSTTNFIIDCYEYMGHQSVNCLNCSDEVHYVCDEAFELLTKECTDFTKYDDLVIEDYDQDTVNKLIELGHQHLKLINENDQNRMFYGDIYSGSFTGVKDTNGNVRAEKLITMEFAKNKFIRDSESLEKPYTDGHFYLYRGITSDIFMNYDIGDSFNEILPFSTSYNGTMAIKWTTNECCIFRIKVPFNYDMVIGSFPPGHETLADSYHDKNQRQYEVTVAPSKLTITAKHKTTLNDRTKIIYDVDIERL